jgi:hypothetical protein
MRFPALLFSCCLIMPIAVSAQVEPDVTHIFSDISIPRGHVVDSATCFFCSIHIEGQLKRDATANWGDVDIEGDVGGDCVAVGGQSILAQALRS